jgi:hypothetical protein
VTRFGLPDEGRAYSVVGRLVRARLIRCRPSGELELTDNGVKAARIAFNNYMKLGVE